jgi:hypothetical protein
VATRGDSLNPVETIRNVVFALLGGMGLVFKHAYQGPLAEIVHSYGGNFAVSFALYFAAVSATVRLGFGRPAAVAATLVAVEVFELTDGFGVMSNVYDTVDLVANAAGVGVALALDFATLRLLVDRWKMKEENT